MDDFAENVFVNCPFDEDYRQLLIAAVFTIKTLGFKPRLALERNNSGETRIQKIVEFIRASKFGIHDLSRIAATAPNEHYRMNMPFELGIDYGCQKLMAGRWAEKRILILEKEKYRYQKALSDLSGSDIKNHDDDPSKIIEIIRNWFIPEVIKRGFSGTVIWNDYNDFQAWLHKELVEEDGHKSVDDVQVIEIFQLMDSWLEQKKIKNANKSKAV